MREIYKFTLRFLLVIVLLMLLYWAAYTKGQVAMCNELGYKAYATPELFEFDCRMENNLKDENNWGIILPSEPYDH